MIINLQREVLEDIKYVAKNAYPKEMFLFLEGKYDKKQGVITITGLAYQPYTAGDYHTLIRADLPLIHNIIGSVHSHPSGNTRPSNADLNTWKKYGPVHFIIGKPYDEHTLSCYDANGTPFEYRII